MNVSALGLPLLMRSSLCITSQFIDLLGRIQKWAEILPWKVFCSVLVDSSAFLRTFTRRSLVCYIFGLPKSFDFGYLCWQWVYFVEKSTLMVCIVSTLSAEKNFAVKLLYLSAEWGSALESGLKTCRFWNRGLFSTNLDCSVCRSCCPRLDLTFPWTVCAEIDWCKNG